MGRPGLSARPRRLLRLLPAGSAMSVLLKRRGVDQLVPLVAVGYPDALQRGRFGKPLSLAALPLDDALPMAQGVQRLRRPAEDGDAPPMTLLLRGELGRNTEVLLLFEHLLRADGFDQIELERLRRCREHMLLVVDKWLRQADLTALRARLGEAGVDPVAREAPG